ncbi:MFS transporter [Paenibacillus sanguinis]|uniref:MFS transporter n=1 Tax=Paenibacillus sanguinis TaxID=225906 RepID=UPI00037D3AC3|nr:MFS transporter [Paenibacillus sanguinis]
MPFIIYVLSLTIFCMTTSEFMVAGMMNTLSSEFDVTVSAVGYLITAFSAAMVIGGPLLTAGLLNVPKKQAFLSLTAVFLAGQTLGALAWNYEAMMVSRIVTGVASSAIFGISVSMCAMLVNEKSRGRAVSSLFTGMMLASVLGTPLATAAAQAYGWRFSFWAVSVLTLLSGVLALWLIPSSPKPMQAQLWKELAAFRNRHLWTAYSTSFLIIGATFAAFSYFSPIFTNVTGFSSEVVPLLLAAYGAATVLGNFITGRLADRYTMQLLTAGLVILAAALLSFAAGAHLPVVAISAILFIGLVGLPMNPPMVARVMRVAEGNTMVNTVHTAIVTFGVAVGSSVGGLLISAGYGLRSSLWLGFGLATVGLLSLLPYLKRSKSQTSIAE